MAKIIETPTLKTERLILKPLKLGDADSLEKYFNNWNIVKNLNETIPWPYITGGCHDFYKNDAIPRMKSGHSFIWTIIYQENPIGLVEIRGPESNHGKQGDRGFWLAETYWKQGFMTEAIAAINDFIFDDLKYDKICVCNYKDNTGSHRVKEKTGAIFIKNCTENWRDHVREKEIWEVTAKSWRAFKEKSKKSS